MNLDEEIFFLGAIREAGKIAALTPRKKWEEMLFPYWETAAHKLFQKHNCPCHAPACFGKQSREKQLQLLTGELGFPAFLSYLEEALQQTVQLGK